MPWRGLKIDFKKRNKFNEIKKICISLVKKTEKQWYKETIEEDIKQNKINGTRDMKVIAINENIEINRQRNEKTKGRKQSRKNKN